MSKFELRPYQSQDVRFMVANRRVLNGNEPGLGKTLETLNTLEHLGYKDTLIVCPKIATGVWQWEVNHWYQWVGQRMTGDWKPKERAELRALYEAGNFDLFIINPAMLKETLEWKSTWTNIIVDEAHLCGLLNPKSKALSMMKKAKCTNMFLLTGTPVRQGPQDLWGMLHLLDKKRFPSYWGFVHRYCHVIKTPFGKEILNVPKNPTEFNRMLKGYMIRHLKKDVLPDLPDKIRRIIPIDMTKKQAKVYKEIVEDMMTEIQDEILMTPNVVTQTLRLRQLLVCPRILGMDEDGAALTALCKELIPNEFEDNRAVVIGTPFRTAVPFIVQAIQKELPGTVVEQIHGQIKETAQQVAQRFQEIPTHRKVLVYTLKTGASWTAHSASTGFSLGYEWSRSEQIQAEDRIHRIGQKNTVEWNYLLHNGTVDELVMNKLDEKTRATGWILDPQAMYKMLRESKICPSNRTQKSL